LWSGTELRGVLVGGEPLVKLGRTRSLEIVGQRFSGLLLRGRALQKQLDSVQRKRVGDPATVIGRNRLRAGVASQHHTLALIDRLRDQRNGLGKRRRTGSQAREQCRQESGAANTEQFHGPYPRGVY